jgi:BMFP domain-containing protein YqiC
MQKFTIYELDQRSRNLETALLSLREENAALRERVTNLETRNNMAHPPYAIEATAALDAVLERRHSPSQIYCYECGRLTDIVGPGPCSHCRVRREMVEEVATFDDPPVDREMAARTRAAVASGDHGMGVEEAKALALKSAEEKPRKGWF